MSLPYKIPAGVDELAAQAQEVARKVGDNLSDRASDFRDTASTIRFHSEDFIQSNPWPAMAIAAACGFALGVLVARR